jgi:cobyrinic acid a,c-diamide synthase
MLRTLLRESEQPPLIAWLEKHAPTLPERHLGLKMPDESDLPDFSSAFHIETVPLDLHSPKQLRSSANACSLHRSNVRRRLNNITIAVAKDAVFCFIYAANIDWLRNEGAEILFFSPLAGEAVPKHADALWLPGGYPELHAKALSESNSWNSLREFIDNNKPVLAECGGMMALGKSIFTKEAQQRGAEADRMTGILPHHFVMQDRLAGLGYREDGSGVRGHEFHHSRREAADHDLPPAFRVNHGDAGIRYKNLRASYIHWYFSSQPEEVSSWFRA